MFRQEMGTRKDLSHREFIEWLEYHRHEEIKELVTETYHLQTQVDELLRQDHAEIISKLDQVNTMVVEILRHVEGFSELTIAVAPQQGLSDDAVGILRLVANSKQGMLFIPPGDTTQLLVDNYVYSSSDNGRFLQDDLETLVSFGMLITGYSGSTPSYKITRRGAKLIELLPQDKAPPELPQTSPATGLEGLEHLEDPEATYPNPEDDY